MFTGIVEELGEVVGVEVQDDDAVRLTIRGQQVTGDAAHGDSIAVNGVCLTVAEVSDARFTADVMAETLARTALGSLVPGCPVNLERPVTLSARLGGHLVQGHVDAVGQVLERTVSEHWETVRVSLPAQVARYVVQKGSITVDGVSLTVVEVGPGWFSVSLIPTTLRSTTLGTRQVGAAVNLEVDVLAKYVESLLQERS
jgi:riboflavin synthase